MRAKNCGWCWRTLGAVGCAALVGVAAVGISAEQPSDPLPLRRVLLPADRLEQELARVRQGVLVQMPRAEFEAKVQAAAAAGLAHRNPPRLAQAQYRARLEDVALAGSGDWKIQSPGAAPAVLSLEPLNLALQNVKLQKGIGETTEAILGQLDGRTLGLLLKKPGEHTALFDWSARGNADPAGIHFELQVPPCALTSLELNLPDDRSLEVDSPCLLAGAPVAEPAGRLLWRIQCPGQATVSFRVRRTTDDRQPAPVVLVEQDNEQRLTPGLLQADYRLKLQVLYNGIRELRLACDPTLRPYDVRVPGLADWEVRPGADAAAPPTLIVRFADLFRGGPVVLRVSALAPLDGNAAWTSPGLRLLETSSKEAPARVLARGERLSLRVHPDVQLENWQPGSFRLDTSTPLAASPSPPRGEGTSGSPLPAGERGRGEGTYADWVLHLTGGPDADGKLRRPGASVKSPGIEFRARQLAWWQVGPDGTSLTAQITYDVIRGRLLRLPVQLPPGWKVDQVELTPTDLLHQGSLAPQRGQSLIVDLQHPLAPGTPARLTLRLRADGAGNGVLPFPDLVPLEARLREGALAISVDPASEAAVQGSSGPSVLAEDKGPWAGHAVDYYYPYRGEALRGRLVVRPRPPRVSARCTNKVLLRGGRATVGVRLTVQADVGRPDAIDLYVSAPLARPWEWHPVSGDGRVRAVQRLEGVEQASRLGVLAARSPLEAAALAGVPRAAGEYWRLRLERPLRRQGRLVLETTLDLVERDGGPGRPRSWEVPLVTVPGADVMDGLVTLQLAEAGSIQMAAEGLQESAVRRGDLRGSWRVLQYGHAPAHLVLHGRQAALDTVSGGSFGTACLATYAAPDGRLLCRFTFHAASWPQPLLPVRLPAGAEVLAIRVDDRWLASPGRQVVAADAPAAEPGVVALLPVPLGQAGHRFEIVYALATAPWALQTRLEAPPPILPVTQPVAFRRLWYLPPGIVPLAEGELRRLPGSVPGGRSQTEDDDESPLALWHTEFAAVRATGNSSSDTTQQLLATASARVRAAVPAGRTWLLGEGLDDLAFELLRTHITLVIDGAALQEAGLESTTPLPRLPPAKPGESQPVIGSGLGLVYVPFASAVLLTTCRQLDAWPAEVQPGQPVGGRFGAALAAAAAHGHDSSGRFRTVVDWLRQADGNGGGPRSAVPLLPEAFDQEWTAWEPIAGSADPDGLRVVRQSSVSAAGLILAALFLLTLGAALGLTGRRSARNREPRRPAARVGRAAGAVLIGGLAASGLALLWLAPALRSLAWWPALAGLGVVGVGLSNVYLRRVGSRSTPPGPRPVAEARNAAIGALVAIAYLAGLSGQAAAPAPVTVFLVPGGADTPEKETVLAPPDLVARLDTLAAGAALKGPVLLEARYQGSPDGEEKFRFVADYRVYCLNDGPTTLSVPLGGVELEVAYLDGARAFPTAAPPPQSGYRVGLEKAGTHTLQLHFTVRPATNGDGRGLLFFIPPVVQSRLSLTVPAGARFLEAEFGRGIQRLGAEGLELNAELGAVRTIHIQWRQESRPVRAVVQVKEAYYWDLGPADSRLLATLQYTVRQGAPTAFGIDLPAGLEVRKVETNALPGSDRAPLLAATTLAGNAGQRRLRLEFQGPVTDGVQVLLELVPRRSPFGPAQRLPVPVPRDVTTTEGLLAYRLRGLEAAEPRHQGVTFLEPRTFARQWQATGAEDPGPPTRAYTFQRPVAPSLQLEGRPLAVHADATQDVSWRVGERQAEVRATARLTDPGGNLLLVDWQVPAGVVVTEVSEVSRREGAARVRQWSQGEGRVQAWLDRPVAEVMLQLTGWVNRPPPSPYPLPHAGGEGRVRGDPARFDLPCLRVLSARSGTTSVHLATEPDLVLEPLALRGLQALPDAHPSTWQAGYVARQGDYGGSFRTRRSPVRAEARVLTFAEVRDRRLTFVATIDYRVHRGELRQAAVRLRNWKGKDVQLEADQVVQRRAEDRDASSRLWLLELQPGVSGTYRVTLRASMSAEGLGDVLMPDVSAVGVAHEERWLALARPELQAADPWGLAELSGREAARAVRPWPGAAERLRRAGGSVWRIQSERWRLRLQPRPASAGSAPLRIELAEQTAALLDGRRWVHEATYWLFHEAGAALDVQPPEGARVLAVEIDGAEVPRSQPAAGHLWLALPGGAGARHVTLRWAFEPSAEPFDRPNLEAPRLGPATAPGEGTRGGSERGREAYGHVPTVWTVHVPAGYQLRWSTGGADVVSAAGADLWRADAQLRLSEQLALRAQRAGGEVFLPALRAAQGRFYRSCRQAEYELAASAIADVGPKGQDLSAWLAELKDANQRQMGRFEEIRTQAERQTRLLGPVARAPAPAPTDGDETDTGPLAASRIAVDLGPGGDTPAYWLTRSGSPTLRLDLAPVNPRPPWRFLAASALVVLLLLGLEIRLAGVIGGAVAWTGWIWPEELAALALLAWPVLGVGLASALLLVAVTGRMATGVRWTRDLLRRPAATETPAT